MVLVFGKILFIGGVVISWRVFFCFDFQCGDIFFKCFKFYNFGRGLIWRWGWQNLIVGLEIIQGSKVVRWLVVDVYKKRREGRQEGKKIERRGFKFLKIEYMYSFFIFFKVKKVGFFKFIGQFDLDKGVFNLELDKVRFEFLFY